MRCSLQKRPISRLVPRFYDIHALFSAKSGDLPASGEDSQESDIIEIVSDPKDVADNEAVCNLGDLGLDEDDDDSSDDEDTLENSDDENPFTFDANSWVEGGNVSVDVILDVLSETPLLPAASSSQDSGTSFSSTINNRKDVAVDWDAALAV
jgi:hypothetical protein